MTVTRYSSYRSHCRRRRGTARRPSAEFAGEVRANQTTERHGGAPALVRLRDERSQNGFQFHVALDDVGFLAFEGDPAFIEPVEHAHARQRILHALRPEQRFPGVAPDDLGYDRVADDTGKRGSDVVRCDATRPFKLDDTHAARRLLKQLCGDTTDVRARDD